MKTFAYLAAPSHNFQLELISYLRRLFLRQSSPYLQVKSKSFSTVGGQVIKGYFITTAKSTKKADDAEILEQIFAAADLAQKLGASILGLNSDAAAVCDKGYTAIRALKIPITTGSALAAWSIFETAFRIAKLKQASLNSFSTSVVNISSGTGSLCLRKFREVSREIKAGTDADIVIFAEETPQIRFNSPEGFRFIQAGRVKMAQSENVIPASLAETMLLTFEGKFINYSLGGNINLDRMEEIADIAAKYGFEIWVPEAPVL